MTARRLVLLRHAKADTPPGVLDEERPLSPRGHADAHAAGAWLSKHAVPQLVLCSPSKRTRQTWHGVSAGLPGNPGPAVRYERRIYHGDVADLLAAVREVDDQVSDVLVIGHNPSLSWLAFSLDPDGDLDSDGLRTCGLTVHSVAGPWATCGEAPAPITATHTARGDS